MRLRLSLVFSLLALPVFADQPFHAALRFANIPAAAQPAKLAVDPAGNLFIVGNIVTPTATPQIRVDKVDPNGNSLGSFEFGGTYQPQNIHLGLFFAQDSVTGAAVDPSGDLVIVGITSASDFPLVSPLITAQSLGGNGFITKLDSQLKNILFSTMLGGRESYASVEGVALDKSGNIYVTGDTGDATFPVTPGAFQTTLPGTASFAFLTEISSTGQKIVFSTFFGDGALTCKDNPFRCPAYAYTEGSAML